MTVRPAPYVELTTGTFGMDPLRFRHYALADALMRVDLTGVGANRRRRELARRLRHELAQRPPGDPQTATPELGGWMGLTLWVIISVLPGLMFWLLTKGWLFGAGRRFRWFMGQRYLAPRLAAGDFVNFASQLTVGVRDRQDTRTRLTCC